jgi:hypothetical protein
MTQYNLREVTISCASSVYMAAYTVWVLRWVIPLVLLFVQWSGENRKYCDIYRMIQNDCRGVATSFSRCNPMWFLSMGLRQGSCLCSSSSRNYPGTEGTNQNRQRNHRLLRLWVRIPLGAWMFVCCECCVLSGRGLCDGPITRPEKSYRLWRVVCDIETSCMSRPWPALGRSATRGGEEKEENQKIYEATCHQT